MAPTITAPRPKKPHDGSASTVMTFSCRLRKLVRDLLTDLCRTSHDRLKGEKYDISDVPPRGSRRRSAVTSPWSACIATSWSGSRCRCCGKRLPTP